MPADGIRNEVPYFSLSWRWLPTPTVQSPHPTYKPCYKGLHPSHKLRRMLCVYPDSANNTPTKVDHLGTLMPLLSELRLEWGSTLASFRDLGSSLSNLRVVWLSACGIRHLDGVGALSGLEELYLAFNDVEDLTSIALHERLEVQDVKFFGIFRTRGVGITCPVCSRQPRTMLNA